MSKHSTAPTAPAPDAPHASTVASAPLTYSDRVDAHLTPEGRERILDKSALKEARVMVLSAIDEERVTLWVREIRAQRAGASAVPKALKDRVAAALKSAPVTH